MRQRERTAAWPRAIAAVCVVAASFGLAGSPANAQVAELRLQKNAFPTAAAPGDVVIFTLSYSCSNEVCPNTRIVDTLPAELALAPNPYICSSCTAPPVESFADPANRTVTFSLGTLGQATTLLAVRMVFPAGTAPGTQAVNRATISADGVNPVSAESPPVTALPRSSVSVSKRLAQPVAQVDTPVTYEVSATLGAGGTETIAGARLVDTLPVGAQFVSATEPFTFAPGTATTPGTVTWPLGDLAPLPGSDRTETRRVTVTFPSPTFAPDNLVTNSVSCFGAAPTPLATDDLTVRLRPTGNVTTAGKTATRTSLGPGQSDTYTITGSNQNAGALSGFALLDNLPPALTMVQDGQPNLGGAAPVPQLSWRAAGGSFQALPTAGAGPWTARAPAEADEILAVYGAAPPGARFSFTARAGIPANGIGRDGAPVVAGAALLNCVTVTADGATPRSACTPQTSTPVAVTLVKDLTSPNQIRVGEAATWALTFTVAADSASDLQDPVLSDCLPPGLELVSSTPPAAPLPAVTPATATPGRCNPGETEVIWSWTGADAFTMARGTSATATITTRATAPGVRVNRARLTAANLPQTVEADASVVVAADSLLVGMKRVKGDRDAAFLSSGTATASPGGSARDEGVITNADPVVTADRIVVIDTLAHPGDTTVSGLARSSAFAPLFASNVTTSHPGVVSYSTSANPCAEELGVTKALCEPAGWSATPPSPPGSVRSIKLDFGSTPLPPGQSITFGFDVSMPATPPSGVAYNTFAFRGFPSASPAPLLVSETAKVGLQASQSPPGGGQGQLTVRKLVNGQDTTVDPLVVPFGSPVEFTFIVTNTGPGEATGIRVVDDKLGAITCPRTTLAAGESMTCTGPPHAALEGLHVNTVEAIWAPAAGPRTCWCPRPPGPSTTASARPSPASASSSC